jgi:hypothetical protein
VRHRVRDIDFWRGFCLIVIVIDHVPGNWLERLTPKNFGLSDAAEAFVFLSGVSAGLVYLPKTKSRGFTWITSACMRRAFKLYYVHILLTLCALVLFAVIYRSSGVDALSSVPFFSLDFGSYANVFAFLTLSYQLAWFGVLPFYVVSMLWAPVALVLTLRDPRLALGASGMLYLAARAYGHAHMFPDGPNPNGLFNLFNLVAWQFIFTIGIVCAATWPGRECRTWPKLLALSGVIVVGGLIVKTDAFGLISGLAEGTLPHLDANKAGLGLGRLIHFMALAYLVAVASVFLPYVAQLINSAAGRTFQVLGRNSLAIFFLGSLLSAGGRAAVTLSSVKAPWINLSVLAAAYTSVSVAVLLAAGLWIERRNSVSNAQEQGSVADTRVVEGALSPSREPNLGA